MRKDEKLLKYMQEAINQLVDRGSFSNGFKFKKTQGEALQAYSNFLHSNRLSVEDRLEGFFDIATGVGKTAIFVAITEEAHKVAEKHNDSFKTTIVVPTTILLNQTFESYIGNKAEGERGFAESLDGKIGLYGDGNTELDKPITIMTYHAWANLSDKGQISADNIDFLVSDEAHRGTSEERVTINKTYKGALRLAFTASSRFDNRKSVENSHKHEIYTKPLADAVRGKELAAYIQCQLFVIRATPTQVLEEKLNNGQPSGWAKRQLKQEAWTSWAVRHYREGVDEHTGDLLSDNQSGFFVDSINHAIHTEESLNSDKTLSAIAAQRGCSNVAVSIHSLMPKKKRQELIQDYKNGKYLAIIGDEVLKEGYDHAPMKSVFDYQHGSLVDKVQILGRGARKWYNENKQREEGLTFCDTIIYLGSNDPKEDTELYNDALSRAVLANDILNDTVIFSDPEEDKKYKRKRQQQSSVERGHPTPIQLDKGSVLEFTTLEDIQTLLSEKEELRKRLKVTMKDIKEAVELYRENNRGKNPSGRTKGLVEHGNFTGIVQWSTVTAWIMRGSNGLSEDPEWVAFKDKLEEQDKLPSLPEFINSLGYSNKPTNGDLTIANINDSITAHQKATNSDPTPRSGRIEHGALKGQCAWKAIDDALRYGARKNLSNDPEWQILSAQLQEQGKSLSIATYMVACGLKEENAHLKDKANLSMRGIRESVLGFKADSSNQRNPNGRMKEFTAHGSLKDQYTWVAINSALTYGNNGLSNDPEWQKWCKELNKDNIRPTLSSFIKTHDL